MTTENLKIFYDEIMIDELDFVSGSNAAQEDFNKTFRSEDKNYKAHEDAIKKIPPITIIPIPMIPITQPISPPKI